MKGAASAVILFGLLIVAFSGCIVPKDDNAIAAAAVTSSTAPVADNQTTDGNKTVNAAPVLVVEIFDNGTLLVAVDGIVNASAGVDLTFEAKNSTDAEGHNITFAWDFGDGNTSAGSNASHSYAAAGNYTLNVTATDEEGATANTSIPLVVASSGPARGTFIRDETTRFTGTVTQPAFEYECGPGPAGTGSRSWVWTLSPAEPDGTATRVSHIVLKITASATNIDTDYELLDPAGDQVGDSGGFEPQDGAEGMDILGDFEPGDYTIVANSCASINATITIDATATYVAA